ncbi:MAG: DUF5131 family protein [Pseudonocardiaceae bacterium]
MATNSAIEWTEVTWKPVTGCDLVAPGCDELLCAGTGKRLKKSWAPRPESDAVVCEPPLTVCCREGVLSQTRRIPNPCT